MIIMFEPVSESVTHYAKLLDSANCMLNYNPLSGISTISIALTTKYATDRTNFWTSIFGSSIEMNPVARRQLTKYGKLKYPFWYLLILVVIFILAMLRALYISDLFYGVPIGTLFLVAAGTSGYDAINDLRADRKLWQYKDIRKKETGEEMVESVLFKQIKIEDLPALKLNSVPYSPLNSLHWHFRLKIS